MDRDPKCKHKRRGIVTTAPDGYSGGAHAAVDCCVRQDCIEDAIDWAHEITGLTAVFVKDAA